MTKIKEYLKLVEDYFLSLPDEAKGLLVGFAVGLVIGVIF
jgi:hypothetical protein